MKYNRKYIADESFNKKTSPAFYSFLRYTKNPYTEKKALEKK